MGLADCPIRETIDLLGRHVIELLKQLALDRD
jgi:hypothetical protein